MIQLNKDDITYHEFHFGTADTEKVLPDLSRIPSNIKAGTTKWNKFAEHWAHWGLEKDTKIREKPGYDKEIIIKKIQALLNSRFFIGRDERLMGAAFLMSEAFEEISISGTSVPS